MKTEFKENEYGAIWQTHKCKGYELSYLINANIERNRCWKIIIDRDNSIGNLVYCPYCGSKLPMTTISEARQEFAAKEIGSGI